ncbi:MAG: OmpA family protein [Gammaproteobacteria bacterium]|nr:OmpA family protein [Gammaproteobacteria bacterium]
MKQALPRLLTFFLVTLGCAFSSVALSMNLAVSPFEGSVLYQSYEARFELVPLLTEPLDAKKNPSLIEVEGAVTSHIYKRPDNVSSYEVYRSYLKTLEDSGFELLLGCREQECNAKRNVANTYRQSSPLFKTRAYKIIQKQSGTDIYLTSYANHYISAKKAADGKTHYVMVIVSDKENLYSVDTLEVAGLEEGTVSISTKMLTDKIASEGKVVLSGIFFDTGKDTITAASAPALETIAQYLKENPSEAFYVVGHTDDTGQLDGNIALSGKRARAVIESLKTFGVDTGRLSGHGVGPFSPAASNASENGRDDNRRVELVLRLK